MSATSAKRNKGGCHQVPRLPRKPTASGVKGHEAKPTVDVTKCHHAARPACQNEGGCCQVPTQSAAVSRATNGDQARFQTHWAKVTQVPRLPRQTWLDIAKCHACQANGTSMTMSPLSKCHACTPGKVRRHHM